MSLNFVPVPSDLWSNYWTEHIQTHLDDSVYHQRQMVDPCQLQTLTVELDKGEDVAVVAICREIPGCASQGDTREEALANISNAIDLCLEVM